MADIKYVSELNFKRGLKGVVDWIKSKFVVGEALDEGGGYVSGFKFQHSNNDYKMFITRPTWSEIAYFNDPTGTDQEMSIAIDNEQPCKWTFKHGAEPNKIDTVKVNGTALTPDSNKAVDVDVPVFSGSGKGDPGMGTEECVNVKIANRGDSDYIAINFTTNGLTLTGSIYDNNIAGGSNCRSSRIIPDETRVNTLITEGLGSISGVQFQVVTDLPTTGVNGVFYLKANGAASGSNIYDEYVWVNKGTTETPNYVFEKLGTMDVDLTDYTKESDFVALSNDEVDAILVEIGVKTATPTP